MSTAARVLAAVVASSLSLAARTARADSQIQADIQWGLVGFELSGVATLLVAARLDVRGTGAAVGASLGSIAAAIATGYVADRLEAPLAGANAVHGALVIGGTLAFAGSALGDDNQLRFGRVALGLGLAGAVGGAWLGARVPTDSYSMTWTWMPIAGAGGGALIGGLWAVAAPSKHPMRTIAIGSGVGLGLGVGLGYVLARRHVGAVYPSPPLAPGATPMLSLGGHF